MIQVSTKKIVYSVIITFFSIILFSQNVPPSITDPAELEATQQERQRVFDSIIEDPTNLDNLFNYANLSILVGVKNYDPPKEVTEKVAVFLDQIENETRLFKSQTVISLGGGISSNANAGLDTDVVTVVGDLGAIDLAISNQPESDSYTTVGFSSQITQDLRHPRGDTINYVTSLSRQVYRNFSNFD